MKEDGNENYKKDKPKGYNIVKFHQKNSYSSIFSGSNIPNGCSTVFFPGCSLSGYSGDIVKSTYEYLSSKIENLGVVVSCCGKPAMDIGDSKDFEENFNSQVENFHKRGIKRVIVACSNCYNTLKINNNIEVISLWEVLRDIGVPEGVKGIYNESDIYAALHDPCPIRNESQIHESVRYILNDIGLKFSEFDKNRNKTQCCGAGKMLMVTNRSLAESIMVKRANSTKCSHIISYCETCVQSMIIGGKKSLHILDLLFNNEVINNHTTTQKSKGTISHWIQRRKTRKIINKDKVNIMKKFLIYGLILLTISMLFNLDIIRGITTEEVKEYILSFGNLAPIIYIILFTIVPLTFFPDALLVIIAGLIFGIAKGYIYTLVGVITGGSLAFFLSRILGSGFIKKLANEKLDKLEKSIEKKGFSIVLILRLIPLFPFDVISYAAGLTNIRYKEYLLATILGTVPGILVFLNIGYQGTDIRSNGFYLSIIILVILVIATSFLKGRVIGQDIKE
ncbi:MAG: VTT domain-containing protein [Clostridium sp.]